MERQTFIAHSDINSCYASIELVFRPDLRDRPVAVGGDEEARHGIVLAKNLIAKRCGVRTGNSLVEARRACPGLITLPPNYPLYQKYSMMAREIYSEYSYAVEPFGLDESWFDLTGVASSEGQAVAAVKGIMARISKELGVTVSVGLSWNKIYAKLGSDYRKPSGLTVINKENYREVVYPLPASDLLYVGPATTAKLSRYGIRTIGELARDENAELLSKALGKVGLMLIVFAAGRDVTPVADSGGSGVIKSVGNSSTFPRDLSCEEDVKMAFYVLAESVSSRMREGGFECGTVQISLRGSDLFGFERQRRLDRPTNVTSELVPAAMGLLRGGYSWQRPLRSVGIRGADLVPMDGPRQLSLLYDEGRRLRAMRLEDAVDHVRDRFGYFALQRALLLKDRRLTGLDAKKENVIHPVSYTFGP
ncbi:MAG: DNA polymerase IV [Oscillospiraceae bacterium]|nr:DNA polymerase IV [Oscillospiraceae bacterium]